MKSTDIFPHWMQPTAVCALIVTVVSSGLAADQHNTPRMLTMRQTLEIAIANNPQVRQQQFAVSASTGDVVTAGLRPNPQLQFNGDVLDFENNQVVNPHDKQYGAFLTVPVELGGKRARRIASAKAALDASGITVDETIRQSVLAAANAWLDALSTKLALDLAIKAKTMADSIVRVNEFRFQRQDIPATEMLRSKISAQQYDLQLAEAQRQVASSGRTLATLLDITDSIEVVESDDWAFVPPPFDSALLFAENHRSDARLSRKTIAGADAAINLQKANAVPDLSLTGDYLISQGVPLYGLSLGIGLPLFSRNQGEIRKALVQKQLAVFSDSSLRVSLRNELASAFDEYESKKAGLDKAKSVLGMSELVLNTVEYAYRSGNTTILDFFEAQRTWYDARQSYIGALIDFNRAGVKLCIAIGDVRPITLGPQ